jgi:hypothetical protein
MIRGSMVTLVAALAVSLSAACSSSSSQPAAPTGGSDAGGLPVFDASSDGWTMTPPSNDAGSDAPAGFSACMWDETSLDQCLWQ